MGRPRSIGTASPLFRQIWQPIEEARAAAGITPEKVADACGFKRASWFVYASHGTIPFHLLEQVLRKFRLRMIVSVASGMSGVHGTPESPQEGTLDYGKKLAELFEDVPPDQQSAAFGAAYTAAKNAIRDLPFEEPAAGARASRSRSSKR